MKKDFSLRSMNIPWQDYREADPENFGWLRFSKVECHGFTLYLTFTHPGHWTIESPKQPEIIQCRCYIHNEETYRMIRGSFDIIDRYDMWIGRNGGDHEFCVGLRYGCYEWEILGDWEKEEREKKYKENPPSEMFDDELFDFKRIFWLLNEGS